ncbi:MAG: hypothetical protein PUD47_09385, partial [Bacteroidales bacterium]|nr:hypothetical protein [Bacteroidales bacterium]
MNRFGVEADDALRWALTTFADYEATHPGSIAATLRSCYALTHEHATCRLPAKVAAGAGPSGRRTSLSEVEAFISAR